MIDNRFRQPKTTKLENKQGGGQDKTEHLRYLEAKMRNQNNPEMLATIEKLWKQRQEKQTQNETATYPKIESLSGYANLAVAGFFGDLFSGGTNDNKEDLADYLYQKRIDQANTARLNVVKLFESEGRIGLDIFGTDYYPDFSKYKTKGYGRAFVFDDVSIKTVELYYCQLAAVRPADFSMNLSADRRTKVAFKDTSVGQFRIRDFSESAEKTGAVLTIDIPKELVGHTGVNGQKNWELKFT